MSAHDAHLAGYRSSSVRVYCRVCGEEWDGGVTEEYGMSSLEPHEECPSCGSTDLETLELTQQDIAERRYESRGLM
jgi:rubrerythrin